MNSASSRERAADARKEQLDKGDGVILGRFGDPRLLRSSRLAPNESPERPREERFNE